MTNALTVFDALKNYYPDSDVIEAVAIGDDLYIVVPRDERLKARLDEIVAERFRVSVGMPDTAMSLRVGLADCERFAALLAE